MSVSVANVRSVSSANRPPVDAKGTRVDVRLENVPVVPEYPTVEVKPPVFAVSSVVAPSLPAFKMIEPVVPTPLVGRRSRDEPTAEPP